jgi:subtilisin family serine protease
VIAVGDTPARNGPNGLTAPGTDVLATLPGSRWGMVSGASYAAAHVSGLLALMIEVRPRSGYVKTRIPGPVAADLVSSADGRIDACASLSRASMSCSCACDATTPAIDSIARH